MPEVESRLGMSETDGDSGRRRKPWHDDARPPAPPEREAGPSYYDIPMLKPHVWTPEVTWYFFLGGLSVGAFTLARVAERAGGERYRDLTRTGAYVSAAAILPCAPLLIRDLGDPKRFHHMLRVWKPRSPMNLGSWVLTGFTPIVLLAALRERKRDGKGKLARLLRAVDGPLAALIDAAGVPLGLLLSTYTGVLLSATATPVWVRNPYLGALFTTSAMSTGAAAMHLAMEAQESDANPHDPIVERALRRIEATTHTLEAVELVAFHAYARERAKPLREGRAGAAFWGGVVGLGLALPVVLDAIPAPPNAKRVLRMASSIATLIGGFALRWAMMEAGKISANDPQAARDASRLKNVTPVAKEPTQ